MQMEVSKGCLVVVIKSEPGMSANSVRNGLNNALKECLVDAVKLPAKGVVMHGGVTVSVTFVRRGTEFSVFKVDLVVAANDFWKQVQAAAPKRVKKFPTTSPAAIRVPVKSMVALPAPKPVPVESRAWLDQPVGVLPIVASRANPGSSREGSESAQQCQRAIVNAGYATIGELVARTFAEHTATEKFGDLTLRHIRRSLEAIGLGFGMDVGEWEAPTKNK